jgi:3-hydroxybutyryl-CoA dehydrogenase
MVVAVLANDVLKKEFLSKPLSAGTGVVWAETLQSLKTIDADVYIDLLFDMEVERIQQLTSILPKPVIVNSVVHTVSDMRQSFIRINGWPSMLKKDIAEVAVANAFQEAIVSGIFNEMGWKYELVPDTPGMITPVIVAMIINEAWYALGEEISTKEEIDIALKLGTNYPMGPFEWCEIIGTGKIIALLKELSKTDARYNIAPALIAINKRDVIDLKY